MSQDRPGAAPRTLVVEEPYGGPDGSANGGYLAGLLAGRLLPTGAVQVDLRRPPPLATPLELVPADAGLLVRAGVTLVAEAAPAALDVDCVEPVPHREALAAGGAFRGLADHPFPRCWVCGTDRIDGLGLRPGPVPGRTGTTATAWTPRREHAGADGTVPAEVVWAALDCPGGWTVDCRAAPRSSPG